MRTIAEIIRELERIKSDSSLETRRCRLWTHNWSKWTDTEVGQMVLTRTHRTPLSTGPDHLVCGNYLVQERQCVGCGKKQLRTVKTYI